MPLIVGIVLVLVLVLVLEATVLETSLQIAVDGAALLQQQAE